jgi:hypothetical protein
MHLSSPRPGTFIGCLALLVAMGGTADAVTHTSTSDSSTAVTLNVATGHISETKSCSQKTTILGKKAFSVAQAAFYSVDLDATISTTAAWKITRPGSFEGPSLSWQVDGTSVGGTSTTPRSKGRHIRFGPGSNVDAAVLWLKPGTHQLRVSLTPFARRDNEPDCASYTTTYSNLHARLSSAN